MKVTRSVRIIRLLTAIQSGQARSVHELGSLLGCCRRTIFRDLKQLRELGVLCEYDSRTDSYRIDGGFFLPPPQLTANEAMGLLLLAYKVAPVCDVPFRNAILAAALKIESLLPPDVRRTCNTALQRIHSLLPRRPQSDQLDAVFSRLQEAVLHSRLVNLSYVEPPRRDPVSMDFCPYHIAYSDGSWYVFGRPNSGKDLLMLKMRSIKEVRMLGRCFVDGPRWDAQEYLGCAWGTQPEGVLYHVVLRFCPEAAATVSSVQWHRTQKTTHHADGSVTMEFRVDGLNEITWWILSYGDRVQVLAPAALRERVVKIASRAIRAHNDAAARP